MREREGGQAFPVAWDGRAGSGVEEGMTLRDWFAGQAMTAYAAHPKPIDVSASEYYEVIAHRSYGIADAMLEKRRGEPSPQTNGETK